MTGGAVGGGENGRKGRRRDEEDRERRKGSKIHAGGPSHIQEIYVKGEKRRGKGRGRFYGKGILIKEQI